MLVHACIIFFLLVPAPELALIEPSQSALEDVTLEFALPPPEVSSPTLPLSSDPQNLLSVEISAPVAWGELSLSLEQAHQPESSVEADVALGSLDVVSAAMPNGQDARFTTQVIADATYTPQVSAKGYKLSRQALERLQKAGLPSDLLVELTALEEQEFASEEMFWHAVEERIGTVDFQQYRQSIVASATFSTRAASSLESVAAPVAWQTSLHVLETKEAWDSVFYYPKIMRNTLLARRTAANRDLDILEEENQFFDILRFFKRWGVPTPLAVVIIGLAVYALLAFLTRN